MRTGYRRRHMLATLAGVGSGSLFSGCLDDGGNPTLGEPRTESGDAAGTTETSPEPRYSEPYPGHGTPFDVTVSNSSGQGVMLTLEILVDEETVHSSEYGLSPDEREKLRHEPESDALHEFSATVGGESHSAEFDPGEYNAVWIEYEGEVEISGVK